MMKKFISATCLALFTAWASAGDIKDTYVNATEKNLSEKFEYDASLIHSDLSLFADAMADSLEVGDTAIIEDNYDYDRLIDLVFQQYKLSKSDINDIRTHVVKAFNRFSHFLLADNGLQWDVKKIAPDNSYILLRSTSILGNINYCKFTISQNTNGFQIDDWQLYFAPIEFTKLYPRLFAASLVHGLLNDELPHDFKSQLEPVAVLFAIFDGNDKDSLKQYSELPQALQQDPLIKFAISSVCTSNPLNDSKESLQVLSNQEQHNPDYFQIHMLNHMAQGRYEQAMTIARDIADKFNDPVFKHVTEAQINHLKGDFDLAIAQYLNIIRREQGLSTPYWALLKVMSEAERFDKIPSVLRLLEAQFKFRFIPENLKEAELFQQFVTTDAFTEWAAQKEAEKKAREEQINLIEDNN